MCAKEQFVRTWKCRLMGHMYFILSDRNKFKKVVWSYNESKSNWLLTASVSHLMGYKYFNQSLSVEQDARSCQACVKSMRSAVYSQSGCTLPVQTLNSGESPWWECFLPRTPFGGPQSPSWSSPQVWRTQLLWLCILRLWGVSVRQTPNRDFTCRDGVWE